MNTLIFFNRYHKTSAALILLAPAAVILSPHPIAKPIDFALAALVPFHTHIGMNYVITDYVPKAQRTLARSGMAGLTLMTFLGLMKMNIRGVGITETVKSMWRAPLPPQENKEPQLKPLPTMFDGKSED